MKLVSLKPRVSLVNTTRVVSISPRRITGRRLMERNARFLVAHPFCDCGARATEIDHKVPLHLGGPDMDANLQALCHDCHAAKTTAEQAARGCIRG